MANRRTSLLRYSTLELDIIFVGFYLLISDGVATFLDPEKLRSFPVFFLQLFSATDKLDSGL